MIKDDLLAEAEILTEPVKFRGHEICVKTVFGERANEFRTYCRNNDLNSNEDAQAMLIAMSCYVDDEPIFSPEDVPTIKQHWSDAEQTKLMNVVIKVGNGVILDEDEKKE